MSINVMNLVRDKAPCRGLEFSVLLCLTDHAHDDGRSCFPSIPTISRESRVCESAVRRFIKKLEAKKIITVRRTAGGRWRKNEYIIHLETLRSMQGFDMAANPVKSPRNPPCGIVKPCTAYQRNPVPGSAESSYEPSVNHHIVAAPLRDDGIPTKQELEEAIESLEQIGVKLRIFNGEVRMKPPPTGDFKSDPAYALVRDAAKGKGREELLALIRSREAEPATADKF